MLDTDAILCRAKSVVPAWILRALHATDSCAARDASVYRAPTSEQTAAFQLYDRLNGTPDTLITLPVVGRDGRTRNTTTSVAALSLLAPDHEARKRAMETTVDAMVRDGWFSRTKLPENERAAILTGQWRGNRGSLERSAVLYDAERCLEVPGPARNGGMAFYSNTDPRALPEWYPNVKLEGHALYPTPRLLSPDVPSTVIRERFETLCTAIHRHLEARNTTLRFHPAIVAAQMPYNVDVRFADPALWYPFSEWRSGNGNPEYLFRNTVRHAVIQPFADGGGFAFSNSPLWFRSIDTRAQAVSLDSYGQVTQGVYNLGSEALSFQCNVADGILDLVRFINAANHLLVTDSVSDAQRVLVDQHAAMTLKANLQPLAQRHAGIPSGQAIVEALQAAERERNARYNRARSEGLGIAGYTSSGDTGADISALTIDSLGLALQAGLTAAAANPIAGVVVAVVMFVVRFGIGLLGLFGAGDRPVDPMTLPFRVLRGSDRPWDGAAVRQSIMLPIPYSAAIMEPTVYRGLT